MFSWAFFVLFLSVGIATPCAAEATTAAPTAAPTPTTTTTTAAPTTTTAAPITSTATTAAPTTSAGNVTTAAPTTTIPTTVPTTTPTPSLPTPARGTYYVSTDKNSTACLKANFGLRLSLMQGEKVREMNLDPKGINATGFCDQNASGLVLTSETITLMFNFTSETKKFQLHALTVTGTEGFSGANANLSVWQAAVGSSYMCNKEQSINITDSLALHTFDLQVQPFAVVNGGFSTAHECSMDDTSILIPIIVGAALAGLILIVVIAYVIGRKKTYVGYQTL